MNERKRTILSVLATLILTGFMVSAHAQEVSIPDAGLNAAIRAALQKPSGPLTEQDLLSLTNLNAFGRGVRSLEGLGAAHNLATLDLNFNQLTNLTLPGGLTSLATLSLGGNQLTSLTAPAGLTSLTRLYVDHNQLTSLTLPEGLTNLTTLDLTFNQLTSLTLPADLTSLSTLYLGFNQLTNFAF